MTRRRRATPRAETPISGVAAGNLGTAANLFDTQLLRSEDLEAAAPGWLEDDGPAVAEEADAIPPDEQALLHTRATGVPPAPARASAAPAQAAPAQAARAPEPELVKPVKTQPRRRSRSVPALAGVAALFVLLLIAGTGILSQLDLGSGARADPSAGGKTLVEVAPSPTPKPRKQAGGDHGKCDGHGHGKKCPGGED
jgi:hypothetical protein